jgi:hypothetical protein
MTMEAPGAPATFSVAGYGHGILQAAFQLAAYGCGFPLAAYRLSYSHHCKRVIIIT